jgi:hypothetical protein
MQFLNQGIEIERQLGLGERASVAHRYRYAIERCQFPLFLRLHHLHDLRFVIIGINNQRNYQQDKENSRNSLHGAVLLNHCNSKNVVKRYFTA